MLALYVTITDTLVPELQIDSVDAPGGIVNITGQTITVTYPVLNVGQTVQFSIFTTVLDGVEIDNTVCVTATNQADEECFTGSVISTLPATGENSFWTNWLFWLMSYLLVFTTGTGILIYHRQSKSS